MDWERSCNVVVQMFQHLAVMITAVHTQKESVFLHFTDSANMTITEECQRVHFNED